MVVAESLVLTLIGIGLSILVSGFVIGSLYAALTIRTGAFPVALPWSLVGAILGGCLLIATLTSTVPVWLHLRAARR